MTTVMSSCSRAMVHKAEMVYSALPSDCSATTGRCGAAMAAPTATGSPCPIAPPVSVSTSCGGDAAVASGNNRPLVLASSEMIAFSGNSAPTTDAQLSDLTGPLGSSGGLEWDSES